MILELSAGILVWDVVRMSSMININRGDIMQLNELFTTGIGPWQWVTRSKLRANASFTVMGKRYIFGATTSNYDNESWEIIFIASGQGTDSVGITGVGNAASVMATVVDILRDFVTTTPDVSELTFSAEEPSRRRLYLRMVQRLLPAWELTNSSSGKFFTLKRPNTDG